MSAPACVVDTRATISLTVDVTWKRISPVPTINTPSRKAVDFPGRIPHRGAPTASRWAARVGEYAQWSTTEEGTMPIRLKRLALMLISCALATPGGAAQAGGYRVVGYATDWIATHARPLDRIDTLIFAFAHVEHGRVVLDGDAATRLRRLLALKRTKPSRSM